MKKQINEGKIPSPIKVIQIQSIDAEKTLNKAE